MIILVLCPSTLTVTPAVFQRALRHFATLYTSAGVLHPFGLGKQLFITTLTSATEAQGHYAALPATLLSFSSYPPSHTAFVCQGAESLEQRMKMLPALFLCTYPGLIPFSFRFCPPCDFSMTLQLGLCECLWLLCIYAQMLSRYCFTLTCCVCSQQTKYK